MICKGKDAPYLWISRLNFHLTFSNPSIYMELERVFNNWSAERKYLIAKLSSTCDNQLIHIDRLCTFIAEARWIHDCLRLIL